MKRLLFYSFSLLLFCNCKKDNNSTPEVVIKGTLLQSSSNPIPVSNYTLSFYQAGNPSEAPIPITGPSSSSATVTTNATGYFECHLSLKKGSFFGIPTNTDSNFVSVTGTTNTGVPLNWFGLNATNHNLQNVFLYKKITRAVVQVVSPAGIALTDTLYVSAFTVNGYYNKMITGLRASQNELTTIDTIPNAVFTGYSFDTAQYRDGIAVAKSRYGIYFSADQPETGTDEVQKTYTINLP